MKFSFFSYFDKTRKVKFNQSGCSGGSTITSFHQDGLLVPSTSLHNDMFPSNMNRTFIRVYVTRTRIISMISYLMFIQMRLRQHFSICSSSFFFLLRRKFNLNNTEYPLLYNFDVIAVKGTEYSFWRYPLKLSLQWGRWCENSIRIFSIQ